MTLIKPTNKWDKLAFNFWTFYRDKNMFFIYENGEFIRSLFGYFSDF